jgi:hypothetical protein
MHTNGKSSKQITDRTTKRLASPAPPQLANRAARRRKAAIARSKLAQAEALVARLLTSNMRLRAKLAEGTTDAS